MALAQQQSDKAPPRDFNKHLFETGKFSDFTITSGATHTFKAHSVILKSSSTWFAKQCMRIEEARGGQLANSVLKLPDCIMGACALPGRQADRYCMVWNTFLQMLKFCYTGEYPKSPSEHNSDGISPFNHARLYLLGQEYEVKEMLPLAVEGFEKSARRLLQVQPKLVILYVNGIYERLGADKDDALLAEAGKIAEHIVDSMDNDLASELLPGIRKMQ